MSKSFADEMEEEGLNLDVSPREGPVWDGPCSEKANGGITFSLLSRFLCDRERFRLLVVEGLKPRDAFNKRLEYGNLWHLCEEILATCKPPKSNAWKAAVQVQLLVYCNSLAKRYPTQRSEIEHWYNVCLTQFPIYVDYWSKNQDVLDRTPLLQEQSFNVPYTLPSGRVVRLRGKWDSVDLIGKGKEAGIWLQENKTKGDVNEWQLRKQLTYDLQVMMYLVALQRSAELADSQGDGWAWTKEIKGVRYNVIRRPLSGGKHTIVQHKPSKSNPLGEDDKHFYSRLGELIKGDPTYFFMRLKVDVLSHHIEKFRRESLDPILEQLCDWWEYIHSTKFVADMLWTGQANRGKHFRMPFGVYNPLLEGDPTDLDDYLLTGSEIGLQRTNNLFPELP